MFLRGSPEHQTEREGGHLRCARCSDEPPRRPPLLPQLRRPAAARGQRKGKRAQGGRPQRGATPPSPPSWPGRHPQQPTRRRDSASREMLGGKRERDAQKLLWRNDQRRVEEKIEIALGEERAKPKQGFVSCL